LRKLWPFLVLFLPAPCFAVHGITLYDLNSTNYMQIQAPATLSTTYQIIIPTSSVNASTGSAVIVTSVSSNTVDIDFSTVSVSGFSVTGSPSVNYSVVWNGSAPEWTPPGGSYAFAIASFSDGEPGTIQIGTGVWVSTGGITFTASYTNGPAVSGYVSNGTGLTMTNSFQGPTASTANVNMPGSPGNSITFTLNAAGAAGSATSSLTHSFNNTRYHGVSTQSGTYSQADVQALASSDLTNSVPITFTVTAGSGQYIVYSYPDRLGTASFTVGGFSGGFNAPQTLSITNASGYTENYYVYRSVNSNLGTTTVVVTTP
jgi:hypothetical protein